MITKFICPFTKTIINEENQIASYLRWTCEEKNIHIRELRFQVYLETFPWATEEKIKDLYLNQFYSLPDFKKEFDWSFAVTQFILDYYNIPKRGHKEAGKISAQKAKITNIERYGVDQTFKVPEFGEKRRQTYIKNYGVDNPFKIKGFHEKVESSYQEKYGYSLRERRSIKSIEAWQLKSPEEKQEWLNKSIKSEAAISRTNGNESSLEVRIQKCLHENRIPFETQFKINSRFFDIFLKEIDLLIEVNGTLWHADPEFYSGEDIIPVLGKEAQAIWARDEEKRQMALDKGYKVVYIWEKEMAFLSDQDLFLLIYEKINETLENQKNNQN